MADTKVKYENKTVTTVRGMEARSIRKAADEGWELVSEVPAALMRTTLAFRRVKKPVPLWPFLLAAGVVAIAVLGFAGVGVLRGGDSPGRTAAESPAATKAIETPSQSATPSPAATAAAPAPLPATTSGLTGTYAQSACDQYGNGQFPYGWDPHFITGLLADGPQGDHWYQKFEADVTNQYGAKRSVDVECTVTGTNDAPTVSDFLAY